MRAATCPDFRSLCVLPHRKRIYMPERLAGGATVIIERAAVAWETFGA